MEPNDFDKLYSVVASLLGAVSAVATYMQARISYDMWRAQHQPAAEAKQPSKLKVKWGYAAATFALASALLWIWSVAGN